MTLAIMSAMAEENASLVAQMTDVTAIDAGQRRYHQGKLWGHDVIVVFSHWGKVAAASTVTYLIAKLGVTEIIFTGVAGAMNPALKVGDIVVAEQLYQHDMDASPIIAQYEIPLLGRAEIDSDTRRRPELLKAAGAFISQDLHTVISDQTLQDFALHQPKVVLGDIASGDQFISCNEAIQSLRNQLPSVACVEMEGAAVAQVCEAFDTPFSIIRTISDAANDDAHIDFPKFIEEVAQVYSLGILKRFLNNTFNT